ncbi:RNA polymerase sigma factor [Demequina lignilytica]|uniref:Sigma-70 family RNA polymerase sigma factor n=1 Tax=Demequina lignilytica TaxID=3051663 RepID=A0AAW7M488_9MICO|nr:MULTISPECIES: sigma-70 family RNA polymerase sigma factor [unclassified Demequina]MDN4478584.1 sigma-70 family RNA polymerase sigma factor [Demequina sp. SYSU T00039-1]MDN4483856.1 sigma-70 family RNA polymerase sigma factor [Demequina sp. SYSU T0a273]MDN4488562.1 sigma-70 family RNA polymerase sigma factor [Demequina sp. SYSU T00039]
MGDSEPIEDLYRVALPRLCRYGLLLTGSEAEGEELVQAAIVKTFSRWRRIDDARAAEQYVRATMRTLTIDAGRRAARWRRAMPRLVEQSSDAPDEAVVAADDVAAAVRALPPRVRVAVALRYLDDLTIAEAADRMGVTAGAVKKYLHTARERLEPWRLAEMDHEAHDAPAREAVEPRRPEGRRVRWPRTS